MPVSGLNGYRRRSRKGGRRKEEMTDSEMSSDPEDTEYVPEGHSQATTT